MLTVLLKHCKNPDIRGGYWIAPVDRKTVRIQVADMKEASRVCCEFRDRNVLGGGNWIDAEISDATGKKVATASYNGRIWNLDGSEFKL